MCYRDMTVDDIPKAPLYPLSEELWGNFCCVRILCRLRCRKMCVSLKQQVCFYLMQNYYFITNYILTLVCLIEYSELYLWPTFNPVFFILVLFYHADFSKQLKILWGARQVIYSLMK